jgi:hypothetical protein
MGVGKSDLKVRTARIIHGEKVNALRLSQFIMQNSKTS